MAKGDDPIFDFDSAGVRDMGCRMIRQARGKHYWKLVKCKDQRSLDQNALYWSGVLPVVAACLEEAFGEPWTIDEAHIECRKQFLSTPVVNRQTGEIETYKVRSTADCDVQEFSRYLDRIADWCHENFPKAVCPRPRHQQPEPAGASR